MFQHQASACGKNDACKNPDCLTISPCQTPLSGVITTSNWGTGYYFRYHHSAWKNGCDTFTAVGLYENWALELRCQVSGVSSENARAGLKPETRNLKPLLGICFIMPDNVQK
jgi:hypothetical protein